MIHFVNKTCTYIARSVELYSTHPNNCPGKIIFFEKKFRQDSLIKDRTFINFWYIFYAGRLLGPGQIQCVYLINNFETYYSEVPKKWVSLFTFQKFPSYFPAYIWAYPFIKISTKQHYLLRYVKVKISTVSFFFLTIY